MALAQMTNSLTEKEEQWLQRIRAKQPVGTVISVVLILAGFGYGLWAGYRLRAASVGVPLSQGFDGPVAQLEQRLPGWLAPAPKQALGTERERRLVEDQHMLAVLASSGIVMLLRMICSSMILVCGLLIFATNLAQRPLLKIIDTLRNSG